MKFFVPKAESPQQTAEIWTANRDHLRVNGYAVTDRRIHARSTIGTTAIIWLRPLAATSR